MTTALAFTVLLPGLRSIALISSISAMGVTPAIGSLENSPMRNASAPASLPLREELNLMPCKTSLSRSRASILAQGFTGESHVLHTLDQKFDSSTSEAARYLIVGIGFDVFGNGVTKGYCAGPIGVCTEWTKAGASTSCGRTRQRRWTLRHTKEKRRTATTSA